MTQLRLRPAAEADLAERLRWYRRQGGNELASRFFGLANEALHSIEMMPGAGAPRFGDLCEIAGLRTWKVDGFPRGWFYVVRDTHVDVMRLLSYAQNLPEMLGQIEPD